VPSASSTSTPANRHDVRDKEEHIGAESTEHIREDIEQSRAHMGETIDAIQERLSPRRMIDDAKETVRAATVGKVTDMMNSASDSASGLFDRVKQNPVPAVLIGVGAWWLLGRTNGGSSRGISDRSASASATSAGADGLLRTVKEHPVPATLAGLGVGWWLLDRQRRATEESNRLNSEDGHGTGRSSLTAMAHDAKDSVVDLSDRAQQRAGEIADQAQARVGELTDRAQTEFDRLLRENPLALGVVAVAVGAAIGLAIPETRAEERVMGETRDRLVSTAREAADGVVEKVQQVVDHLQGGADKNSNQAIAGAGEK
jgi:hypothetical protein